MVRCKTLLRQVPSIFYFPLSAHLSLWLPLSFFFFLSLFSSSRSTNVWQTQASEDLRVHMIAYPDSPVLQFNSILTYIWLSQRLYRCMLNFDCICTDARVFVLKARTGNPEMSSH